MFPIVLKEDRCVKNVALVKHLWVVPLKLDQKSFEDAVCLLVRDVLQFGRLQIHYQYDLIYIRRAAFTTLLDQLLFAIVEPLSPSCL